MSINAVFIQRLGRCQPYVGRSLAIESVWSYADRMSSYMYAACLQSLSMPPRLAILHYFFNFFSLLAVYQFCACFYVVTFYFFHYHNLYYSILAYVFFFCNSLCII